MIAITNSNKQSQHKLLMKVLKTNRVIVSSRKSLIFNVVSLFVGFDLLFE